MTDGTVRAKCFGVVDDDGNVRASMGLDRLGAVSWNCAASEEEAASRPLSRLSAT